MPFPLIPLLIAGGGALGSSLLERRRRGGAQDALNTQTGNLRDLQQFGLDQSLAFSGPQRDLLLQLMQGIGLNPEQLQLLAQMGGGDSPLNDEVLARLMQTQDALGSTIQYGGQTAQSQDLLQNLINQALGRNPEQMAQLESAMEALGQRGRTPQLDFLGGQARDLVSSGGRTRGTDTAQDVLLSAIQSGGIGPQTEGLRALADQIIRAGGKTEDLQQLFNTANSIMAQGGAGGALMPMGLAQSFARDEAGTAGANAAEAAYRTALQRGGGPGAVVDSGLQNRALAEFQTQRAQGIAQAVREATRSQQQLQLQQLLGAMGASNQASQAVAQRLGIGAGAAEGAGRIAADIFGTGVRGFGDLEQQVLARVALGMQSGLSVEQAVLAALSNAQEQIGQAMQGRTGAGQAATGVFSQESQRFNEAVRNMLASGQIQGDVLNQRRAREIDLYGERSRLLGQGQGTQLASAGQLGEQARANLNFAGQTMNPLTTLAGGRADLQAQPGILDQLLRGITAGASQTAMDRILRRPAGQDLNL